MNDWWSTSLVDGDKDEDFDIGAMCIGNLDNASPPRYSLILSLLYTNMHTLTNPITYSYSNKIIIGSQQGIIRIFNPTKLGYRIEDLIYEADLGSPILQVLIGKFLSANDQSLGLAVLHPKKLVIFELLPGKAGESSGGTNKHSLTHYYSLLLTY